MAVTSACPCIHVSAAQKTHVCVFVWVCENAIQQVAAAVSSNRYLIQATQQPWKQAHTYTHTLYCIVALTSARRTSALHTCTLTHVIAGKTYNFAVIYMCVMSNFDRNKRIERAEYVIISISCDTKHVFRSVVILGQWSEGSQEDPESPIRLCETAASPTDREKECDCRRTGGAESARALAKATIWGCRQVMIDRVLEQQTAISQVLSNDRKVRDISSPHGRTLMNEKPSISCSNIWLNSENT